MDIHKSNHGCLEINSKTAPHMGSEGRFGFIPDRTILFLCGQIQTAFHEIFFIIIIFFQKIGFDISCKLSPQNLTFHAN